jgi:hypothetical protein
VRGYCPVPFAVLPFETVAYLDIARVLSFLCNVKVNGSGICGKVQFRQAFPFLDCMGKEGGQFLKESGKG